jgi:hypothetical protein
MFFIRKQNKSEIDKPFLISLVSLYIDGLVLNHLAGMMIPSATGIMPKAIKADITTALILLEESIVEKKCAPALFTLINLPNDDELSPDDLQRKMRCKMQGDNSEWLLSCMDQSLLKAEATTRTIARLEDYYAQRPEIFNDLDIISRLKRSISAVDLPDGDICESIVDGILSNPRCPTDRIISEQSKSARSELGINPIR